jgi:anti-sigma B factor antagonist
MTFNVSTGEGGVIRLVIEGELDALSSPNLRNEVDKLVAAQPPRIEVDLTSLRMVDSSGVGALVSLYKRVRAQGGAVLLMGLRDQPLAIFRLLRLDRVMVGADLPGPNSPMQRSSSDR